MSDETFFENINSYINIVDDMEFFYKIGNFQEVLEILEKEFPQKFPNISNMRLEK